MDKLRPAALTILSFEEPETHLAPQYLRRIKAEIDEIAGGSQCQVLITSHSESIVSRTEPHEIRYFRLNEEQCADIRTITLPDDAVTAEKYVRQAIRHYPELYFAKAVVLVEGDSERLILPKLFSLKSERLHSAFISVVPLAGRHVNHMWRLLNQLGLPYYTLLDLDRGRAGGGWGRLRYAYKQLLQILDTSQRKALLKGPPAFTVDEIHTMEQLEPSDVERQEQVIRHLEKFHLYFSTPLDFDFSMLRSFGEAYYGVTKKGPNDADSLERSDEVARTILAATNQPETSYSNDDRLLFPWYAHLFIQRSKPTSHLLAWQELEDPSTFPLLPPSLRRLIRALDVFVSGTEDE